MAKVCMENIVKTFGNVRAVDNVSLDIADGLFVVLVGPSGCGKTTLLRLLAGLETVNGGRITIGERDVTYVHPRERNIAMVFQSYALYPHMTVKRNMAFALELKGMPASEIEERISLASELLGIRELLDRRPRQLSGGQRQRVALGRSIVREPAVFLFDEPLSNLDAKLRTAMRTELIKLHKRLGTTTVYVTHDQVEAMTMGEVIVVMKDGVVQQAGPPLDVYHNPENIFVAGFIGSPAMNFVPGRVHEDGKRVSIGDNATSIRLPDKEFARLRQPGESELLVGIRPEHLRIDDQGPTPGVAVTIGGVIDVVEPLGAETIIEVNCGGFSLVVRLGDDKIRKVGQEVTLNADLDHVFFFGSSSGCRVNIRS